MFFTHFTRLLFPDNWLLLLTTEHTCYQTGKRSSPALKWRLRHQPPPMKESTWNNAVAAGIWGLISAFRSPTILIIILSRSPPSLEFSFLYLSIGSLFLGALMGVSFKVCKWIIYIISFVNFVRLVFRLTEVSSYLFERTFVLTRWVTEQMVFWWPSVLEPSSSQSQSKCSQPVRSLFSLTYQSELGA